MSDWTLACPDWQQRIRAGRSLVPALPLNRKRAATAVAIFDRLRIPDVPGTPTFAEAGGDWFRDIVAALHGAFDPQTRQRAIRELFLLVPKKNGKTTYGAGLMLTSVLLNDRPKAEFLLVAPTQQVADLAFSQVAGMIALDATLAARFEVQGHAKKVTYKATGATLRIKSFDVKVMTGVKPSGVLIDELHVMAESSHADRVIGQVRGGIVSQSEGFVAFITTQSERVPKGVFKAELAKARAIRDGEAFGKMLPVLYEFPPAIAAAATAPGEAAPWQDPALWPMVMPNQGRSITVARLVEDYETARLAGPEELRRWATQHLNVEVGLALRADRWAGADYWQAAAEPGLDLDAILVRCDVVCVGIDGGGLDDLLGLGVLGRERGTRHWLHWGHAWAYADALERRKAEAPRLRDLQGAGELTIVDALGQDIEAVADCVRSIDQAGLLALVGLDPVGIGAIVDALAERGITGERVAAVTQGWKLAGAIKTVERKVADGTLRHGGQALMAWAVGNAKVEPKGNAILITKQASGSAKIDPLMALFDAAALMASAPDVEASVYTADRGLVVFG